MISNGQCMQLCNNWSTCHKWPLWFVMDSNHIIWKRNYFSVIKLLQRFQIKFVTTLKLKSCQAWELKTNIVIFLKPELTLNLETLQLSLLSLIYHFSIININQHNILVEVLFIKLIFFPCIVCFFQLIIQSWGWLLT